jgi:hypothetical protein
MTWQRKWSGQNEEMFRGIVLLLMQKDLSPKKIMIFSSFYHFSKFVTQYPLVS